MSLNFPSTLALSRQALCTASPLVVEGARACCCMGLQRVLRCRAALFAQQEALCPECLWCVMD